MKQQHICARCLKGPWYFGCGKNMTAQQIECLANLVEGRNVSNKVPDNCLYLLEQVVNEPSQEESQS